MPPIQAANIGDLVTTTLRDLGRMKFTDITSDLIRKIAMRELMKEGRQDFQSGYELQFNLMTNQNGSARFVGLGATDNTNITDVMTTASVPWRHVTWNYAIERRELAMNRTPAKIVDLIQTRRLAALVSASELFETAFWSLPAATDTVSPLGVPYWVVKSATAGFNTTAPSGYTTVAGILPTAYSGRWANYAFPYTNITKDDFIAAWWLAATRTDFEPSVEGMPTYNTGDRYGFYTNLIVYNALKQQLEAQNDDLGNDLDTMNNEVHFRRAKVTYVPVLDADTTNPMYGLNWGEFRTGVLQGEWMNETKIPIQPGQHTVSAVHVDCSFQWFTRNRRRHFVGSNGTTLPA
jgi:hypothetical protein